MPRWGPDLEFAAWGLSSTRRAPWLYVFKTPADAWPDTQAYFEQAQLQSQANHRTLRVSELREVQLHDGIGYTFTTVGKDDSGRHSETVFGALRRGYEYRLVFIVDLEQLDEYEFLFDDIAKTFDVAD
jgi:hypothetical protein